MMIETLSKKRKKRKKILSRIDHHDRDIIEKKNIIEMIKYHQ